MITREDLDKMIEKNAEEYGHECWTREDYPSNPFGDFIFGAQSIAPMLLKALESLDYCYNCICKHTEDDLNQDSDRRQWCSGCASWVYKDDWIQIAKTRTTITEIESMVKGDGE